MAPRESRGGDRPRRGRAHTDLHRACPGHGVGAHRLLSGGVGPRFCPREVKLFASPPHFLPEALSLTLMPAGKALQLAQLTLTLPGVHCGVLAKTHPLKAQGSLPVHPEPQDEEVREQLLMSPARDLRSGPGQGSLEGNWLQLRAPVT